LLLTCCKLDPASLLYRRTLRQTEKTKYHNNLRGSRLAFLTTSAGKARVKAAMHARDYLKVLEYGEDVLVRNPWDTGVQLAMAAAAEKLDLLDLAVWMLDQARQKNPKDVTVNRAMARLLEKRGNFSQAMIIWEMIRSVAPKDQEAREKAKDLAASATIARGHYEAVVEGSAPACEMEAEDDDADQESPKVETPRPISPAAERLAAEAARLRGQIEKDPTSAPVYLNLAALYRRNGRFEEARAVLEEGLGPTGRHFDLTTELTELAIEPFR